MARETCADARRRAKKDRRRHDTASIENGLDGTDWFPAWDSWWGDW